MVIDVQFEQSSSKTVEIIDSLNLPRERYDCGNFVCHNGQLYVFGGVSLEVLGDLSAFNVKKNLWTTKIGISNDQIEKRQGHSTCL